ncbi:DUF6950 family protein [Desulfocurvibacter africanus]|uniref:DUF6950 family protein n=1 Tax=Desulfocurvibacter africanus TaxID=873 RepID=UPI000314A7D3|nr:hypothetical protein [Desulfocurvibacter africanus]
MSSFARLTSELLGREYELGRWDCFALVLHWLELRGVQVPEQFEGVGRDDYAELFRRAPEEAKALMGRFFDTILEPCDPRHVQPGDILLVRPLFSEAPAFTVVYAGNGQALSAVEGIGTNKFTLTRYEPVRGWQCPRQYHTL